MTGYFLTLKKSERGNTNTMENQIPTPEETVAVLEAPVDDELDALSAEDKTVALKLINGPWYQKLKARAEATAEAKKAKELDAQVQDLIASNKAMMTAEIDKLRKANEPLKPEELEKLVNQEYLEFKISLPKHRDRSAREFVIRELPIKVEKKLVNTLKKTLGSVIKDMSRLNWTTEMSNLERITELIDMVPGALDTIADCAAVCLNPFDEDPDVDKEWVLDNLTTAKILAVLQLQAEANRWRDFFSAVARAIPSQMMG